MSINDQQVSDYQTNGFMVLRNIFSDWIPTLSRGADVAVFGELQSMLAEFDGKFASMPGTR
jgi:hypothetical protein